MKTIGLIGGMSWESTAEYYRIINERVRDRLGGLHSAKIILVSVDFAEIEEMQAKGRWDAAGEALSHAARQLEVAGADVILICTNTMHKVADAVESATNLPLLHLADATAERVLSVVSSLVLDPVSSRKPTIGLLGTAFTMEQAFYKDRLASHGIEILVPAADDRAIVHRIIYDELCLGIVKEESRAEYQRIMQQLVGRGAEGIVLGCTEIELLINPDEDSLVPLFPTSRIHAEAAVDWALSQHTRSDL